MHDPKTVAFDIYLGSKRKKNGNYKSPFITIWHNDPETDGTDDSCGWFIRERHCNKEVLEKIKKEFDFNLKYNYWFTKEGKPIFSTIGTVMMMYKAATWIHFNYNRKKMDKFFRKYTSDIIHFAENPVDCIGDTIINKWNSENNIENIRNLAGIIYSDILRKERKWYQHPKWHIHHWSIQFHPFQQLKRRFFDKCSICGKRGFKGAAYGDWYGTKLWHAECDNSNSKPSNLIETV